MSHQPGHPPGYHSHPHPHPHPHPAYSPQPVVPYGYAPLPEYQPELEALPSIRSLSHMPPVSAGQAGDSGMGGMGSGVGLGLGQPFYGVVPVGAQLVQPDFMARYPALPPDHRFRGPKKVCACAFFHGYYEIKRRTKTGCMTCRKRRIKCDETHPTCNNCRKSKRECLGYDPIFKQQPQQHPPPPAPDLTPAPENQPHRPSSHGTRTPQTPQPRQQTQSSLPTPHQSRGRQEEPYLSYNSPLPLQQQQQQTTQTGPRDARLQAQLPSVASLSESTHSGAIDPSVLGPASTQGFGHPFPPGNSGRDSLGPAAELLAARSVPGGHHVLTGRPLGPGAETGPPDRGGAESDGYGPEAARRLSRVPAAGDLQGGWGQGGVRS